jgi:hypothetical protein
MNSRAVFESSQRAPIVDAAMDAYLSWREKCTAVSNASRRWANSRDADADAETARQAYEAARASEEHASRLYLELARRVAGLGATGEGRIMSGVGDR